MNACIYEGHAVFWFTDYKGHDITWTVMVSDQPKKYLRRKISLLKKSQEGFEKDDEALLKRRITYLAIHEEGDSLAIFNEGRWIKRPDLFKGKMVRNIIRMLMDLYG